MNYPPQPNQPQPPYQPQLQPQLAPTPQPQSQPQPQYQPQPQPQPQYPPQPQPPPQPQTRFLPDPKAQIQPPPQQQAPPIPEDGIDRSQIARVQPEIFTVDFLIDGIVQGGLRLQAMNLQCLLSQLEVLAAINMPRVGGWNVYDASRRLVAAITIVEFVAYVAEKTTLSSMPGDKSAAGWRAMPLVTQTSPDFQQAQTQARKDGRLPP